MLKGFVFLLLDFASIYIKSMPNASIFFVTKCVDMYHINAFCIIFFLCKMRRHCQRILLPKKKSKCYKNKMRCNSCASEPEFYRDLVYKFKKIKSRTDFFYQLRKIIIRHKRIDYDLNVMQQSACLVIYPITVDNFDALFNCTPVDRASDSMMSST